MLFASQRDRQQAENDARRDQFIECPISLPAYRLKKFLPSEWHQSVYVKADLLKVVGRVPGGHCDLIHQSEPQHLAIYWLAGRCRPECNVATWAIFES